MSAKILRLCQREICEGLRSLNSTNKYGFVSQRNNIRSLSAAELPGAGSRLHQDDESPASMDELQGGDSYGCSLHTHKGTASLSPTDVFPHRVNRACKGQGTLGVHQLASRPVPRWSQTNASPSRRDYANAISCFLSESATLSQLVILQNSFTRQSYWPLARLLSVSP
jgi:hypothetical protein